MARLILVAAILAALVAVIAFVSAALGRAAGNAAGDAARGTDMSNGVNKVAFAALLVLLFGVATGWLGGL